jgi:pyruvyltransferase
MDTLFWHSCGYNNKNAGDLVGPYLYEKITGIQPIRENNPSSSNGNKFLLTCGSIVNPRYMHPKRTIIWGSGIIKQTLKLNSPNSIHAVRGPLTRNEFLKNNIECPEVYGDPAILLRKFYTPKIDNRKEFKLGIIPHYVDYSFTNKMYTDKENIKIIDICNDVENVIDEISECSLLISTSLHGIIFSHTYGRSCAWSKSKVGLYGNDCKFADYFLTTDLVQQPVNIFSKKYSIQELSKFAENNLSIQYGKNELFYVCPFK